MTLQLRLLWRKPLTFNQCHLFLLVKVYHLHLKGGLILVTYGAGKWGTGQTGMDILLIGSFFFQDLFRGLLTKQRCFEARLMLRDIFNQIFLTWKLKHSLLYLAGWFPQLSNTPEKVSSKQFHNFLFNSVLLFSLSFFPSFFFFLIAFWYCLDLL